MRSVNANDLRALWLKFFQQKGHAVIPSASVIPENDPTVLRAIQVLKDGLSYPKAPGSEETSTTGKGKKEAMMKGSLPQHTLLPVHNMYAATT